MSNPVTVLRVRMETAEARLRGVLLRRGVSLSPCDICGYGGADYYQPSMHSCIGDILDASQPDQDTARLLAMIDGTQP